MVVGQEVRTRQTLTLNFEPVDSCEEDRGRPTGTESSP